MILAEALCETYEDEVSYKPGSASFSIAIISADDDEEPQSADGLLSGSLSSVLLTNDQYLYISDFTRVDGTRGSVDIVSMQFTVDAYVNVVCHLVNSDREELYNGGVSKQSFHQKLGIPK